MGQFISPDPTLETSDKPHLALNVPIYSGHKAINAAEPLKGRFRIFDELVTQTATFDLPYEDQCSAQY